jgi:tetratricopeptide (TPR) repeat protein
LRYQLQFVNPTNDSDIDADDADALVYEGQLLFRNAEYSKAARYFAKAIKADSTKSQAWFGLAKAQMYASSVSPFDMITYIHVDEGSIPFMGISNMILNDFMTVWDSPSNPCGNWCVVIH